MPICLSICVPLIRSRPRDSILGILLRSYRIAFFSCIAAAHKSQKRAIFFLSERTLQRFTTLSWASWMGRLWKIVAFQATLPIQFALQFMYKTCFLIIKYDSRNFAFEGEKWEISCSEVAIIYHFWVPNADLCTSFALQFKLSEIIIRLCYTK